MKRKSELKFYNRGTATHKCLSHVNWCRNLFFFCSWYLLLLNIFLFFMWPSESLCFIYEPSQAKKILYFWKMHKILLWTRPLDRNKWKMLVRPDDYLYGALG